MLLVSYGDVQIDLDCAFLALAYHGEWEATRDRLALALAAAEQGAQVPPARLRAAEEAFRRKRHLLAAEDLTGWLSERDRTVSELRRFLRTEEIAEELAVGPRGAAGPIPTDQVPAEDVAGAARLWALLGGPAAHWARRLVLGAAAAELGPDQRMAPDLSCAGRLRLGAENDSCLPLEDRSSEGIARRARLVIELSDALQAAPGRLAKGDVEEVVDEKRLDWTELVYSQISLASEGAAREALLCINHDGIGERELAEMAEAPVDHVVCWAEEVSAPLQGQLLSAQPRTAIGPLEVADRWAVTVLHERRPVSAEDRTIFGRACTVALERKLDRRLAGRAKWYAVVN